MTTEQINNLKQLVQNTHALSSYEKNEWLALLDLMDDKQLGELKKILETAESKFGAPVSKPVVQPLAQMPKLSHIMNMPHIAAGAKVAEKVPEKKPATLNLLSAGIKAPVVTPSVKIEEKKPNKFLQRIKNILAEKELPAPKITTPLELSAPDPKAVKTPILPIKKPVPVEPPTVKLPEKPPVVMKKPEPVKPTQFKPVMPQGASISSQSGIAFGRTTDKDKEKMLEEIKHNLQQKKQGEPMQVSISAKNVNILQGSADIDTLDDLITVTPKIFSFANSGSVVKKIRLLIQKNGYHEVVFNIEKSPLYKAYIKTGAEILDNKTSFADLDMAEKDGYLNKQNFESCVDLLRLIQAG